MSWETLPTWFWIVYYLFLILTLGTAIFSFLRKKMGKLSIAAILFAVFVPIITVINSMGRTEGMNEFEHIVSQLQQGAIWSVFAIIGYLFLLAWWILFLFKRE